MDDNDVIDPDEFGAASADAATFAPDAVAQVQPLFCNVCGMPWSKDQTVCAACEKKSQEPPPADGRNYEKSILSALGLYLFFLATSFVEICSIRLGADADTIIVWDEILFSAVVLIWAAAAWRSVGPPLRNRASLKAYPMAVGASVLTYGISTAAIHALNFFFKVPMLDPSGQLFADGHGGLYVFMAICVQPGIIEEIAFRGIIYGALAKVLGKPHAVVVSAALFSIIHLSVPSMPNLFILGLALGFFRARTGSLSARHGSPCLS